MRSNNFPKCWAAASLLLLPGCALRPAADVTPVEPQEVSQPILSQPFTKEVFNEILKNIVRLDIDQRRLDTVEKRFGQCSDSQCAPALEAAEAPIRAHADRVIGSIHAEFKLHNLGINQYCSPGELPPDARSQRLCALYRPWLWQDMIGTASPS